MKNKNFLVTHYGDYGDGIHMIVTVFLPTTNKLYEYKTTKNVVEKFLFLVKKIGYSSWMPFNFLKKNSEEIK